MKVIFLINIVECLVLRIYVLENLRVGFVIVIASKKKKGPLSCEKVNKTRRMRRYCTTKCDQIEKNYKNTKRNAKKRLKRKV